MVGAQRCVEERVSRKESGAFHRDDGRRGRRTEREILSELGADARRKKYSGKIFYAIPGVRALPRGCVQAVEQFGASFFFVQQSVYRKSIEYMQDVAGVKSSKWCAGCHDPALLFSGMFDSPIRQIENTPAAQAGL